MSYILFSFSFFFFNDTATTEIYTLSLHDALPISHQMCPCTLAPLCRVYRRTDPYQQASYFCTPRAALLAGRIQDRKSTRLNSSHSQISYAVFCLKKKKKTTYEHPSSIARLHTVCS